MLNGLSLHRITFWVNSPYTLYDNATYQCLLAILAGWNLALTFQVITWATYHKDDPPPPEDDENKEKRTDDISSWDADFLKVDQGTLFELILAANYLDIKVKSYPGFLILFSLKSQKNLCFIVFFVFYALSLSYSKRYLKVS